MISKNMFSKVLTLSATMLISGFCAGQAFPAQTDEPKWKPLPVDEIGALLVNKTLSEAEIVRALVAHLDQRISMSRLLYTTYQNTNPPYEYGMIVWMIAERVYPAKPKGRPEVIEAVIKSLGPVENEKEVRSYLNLALGIAGGTPDEDDLLRMLGDPDTDEITLSVVLQAMSRSSKVPIRSLPRVLELADHPMSSIAGDSCAPPHNVQRKYAIRDLVLECLDRLGIKAEKTLVDDGTVDPASGKPLPETRVSVDRTSLVNRLKGWIVDDDPKVWRAGIDVAKDIPGEDVGQMIDNLRVNRSLNQEKLRHLKKKES